MGGRGSSRGGSALPRSSVAPGFGRGARPRTLTLTLRPSLVVSSWRLGSRGSPGIGLIRSDYSRADFGSQGVVELGAGVVAEAVERDAENVLHLGGLAGRELGDAHHHLDHVADGDIGAHDAGVLRALEQG